VAGYILDLRPTQAAYSSSVEIAQMWEDGTIVSTVDRQGQKKDIESPTTTLDK